MASRAEITSKYAKAYAKVSKKDKGRVRDQVMEVTGWSRDNARRRLRGGGETTTGCWSASREDAQEVAGVEILV